MISILILFKIFLGMDQTPGEVYTLAKVFFDVSRVRWGVFWAWSPNEYTTKNV